MRLPYSDFHSQTLDMKASRPRSWRVWLDCFIIIFSTTDWVAIPAWSVPVVVCVGGLRLRDE